MEIVKFITAGSVDDGKSTLIGRLLYDTQSIYKDQLDAVGRATKTGDIPDLSLLTDGLRSEREQGITIDVAYRYFQTPKRKFIIVDAPGHIQYTRNMVTGASNCNVALILIDARNGILTQTLRHSYIAKLLGIRHVFVCINKMDLVDYSEQVFEKIVKEYKEREKILDIHDLRFFPVSAMTGENIAKPSDAMTWHKGQTLLDALETVSIQEDFVSDSGAFYVQYVLRANQNDYRAYAGRVEEHPFVEGEKVKLFPSQLEATIDKIDIVVGDKIQSINKAEVGASVAIRLKEDVDISRGELMIKGSIPNVDKEITSMICWIDTLQAKEGNKYILQIGTQRIRVVIRDIIHKVNIETYEEVAGEKELKLNDVAKVVLRAASPIAFGVYEKHPSIGRGILIDETTNNTVAACIFV